VRAVGKAQHPDRRVVRRRVVRAVGGGPVDVRREVDGDLGDVADEPPGVVEHVRAEVAERPGAAAGVEAPLVVGSAEEAVLKVEAPRGDASDEAVVDERFQIAVVHGGAHREERHVDDARGVDGIPHRGGLVGVRRERLLAQHVDAAPRGRDRDRRVQLVGGDDDDRVDEVGGEQLLVAREHVRDAPAFGDRARPLRVAARDRDELDVVVAREVPQVGLGVPGRTDHADAHARRHADTIDPRCSGASRRSVASTAAPRTPARAPAWEATICSFSVASGVDSA
jgi:hypothetical protein